MNQRCRPAVATWLGMISSARDCMERLELVLAVVGEECPELADQAEEAARLVSASAAGLGRLAGAARIESVSSRN